MNISKDQQKNCFLFLSCHSKQPLKTIPSAFLVLVLFLRFFFFFMGTILKVFIELVTIFLLLFVLCLVTLLCPTLRPRELSLPGSSVHGIPQARIHCSGLPCAPPGDLPNPGIKPRAPPLQADSLPPP